MDPKAFVTNEALGDAVDTLLMGMGNMLEEQKKIFATKEDLKKFATLDDLKREVGWLKDDIKGLTSDLADVPTRKEFNEVKVKVEKFLAS